MLQVFGDEYFGVGVDAGQIGLKMPSYATADDVRKMKFNIDDFLPNSIRSDVIARNNLIEFHLRNAADRLREELALFAQRGFTADYKIFSVYYAIWGILLAGRGQDGSAVSDQNIQFYAAEWQRVLAQMKRKKSMNGIGLGRG